MGYASSAQASGAAPALESGGSGAGAASFRDIGLEGALDSFRAFLREHNIVCELNPTSNHMLLGDSFVEASARNRRTLCAFLDAGRPVVLCTDDDGIWAIPECSEHRRHASVAHEFCQAIMRDDITTEDELELLLRDASRTAFASRTAAAAASDSDKLKALRIKVARARAQRR